MLVHLPSNGVMGISDVQLNPPTLGHLRTLSLSSYTDEELKTAFVRLCLQEPDEVFKISLFDRDYLFKILVSAIHLNKIVVRSTCTNLQCLSALSTEYNIAELSEDLLELDPTTPRVVEKEESGRLLRYHLLSVEDELAILSYAKEDFDKYPTRYEDAEYSMILGYPATDEGVSEASSLPIYQYYSALAYLQTIFHGVPDFIDYVCPHCGTRQVIMVPFVKSILEVDSAAIVNNFMRLREVNGFTFESFLSLTLPEFNQVLANLTTME